MAIVTAQQILDYYEKYRTVEVTFTKEVIQATGLIPNQTLLKSLGDFWPCVPYSASMAGAKVIANLNARFFEAMRTTNNLISLRLSFRLQDKPDPLSLFITTRAAGFNRYSKDNPDVYFLNLAFSQKPPDDFIYIVGRLLDANLNATKRREERIIITADTIRGLGLKAKETRAAVGKEARACILRDISFSGVKILMLGASKVMEGQPARVAIAFEDEEKPFIMAGTVVRFEGVQGRTDIGALAVKFDEAQIPIQYKVHLNAHVKRTRMADIGAVGEAQAPQKPRKAPAGAAHKPEAQGASESTDQEAAEPAPEPASLPEDDLPAPDEGGTGG
jgi:hypothetical protein